MKRFKIISLVILLVLIIIIGGGFLVGWLSSKKKSKEVSSETKECKIPAAEKTASSKTTTFIPKTKLEVKGIVFADLFEWMGTPGSTEFSLYPENPDCRAKVLDHAMEGPARIGAGWIGMTPNAVIKQVNPLVIGDENNDISLSDESHYAAIIEAARRKNLKIAQTESLSPSMNLTKEHLDELTRLQNSSPLFWEDFFNKLKERLVERAKRAEKYKAEILVLYLFPEDTFRGDVYPEYGKRWKEIIAEVRKVYSGKIALNMINADEKLNFADDLDVLMITVFDGLYTSRKGAIANRKNPTLQELVNLTEDFFDKPRSLFADKLPIYYILTVTSTDGQEFTEEPKTRGTPDFEEQALYYKAFFKAMEDETWIKGFFSERWDWFDQHKRKPDEIYYDQTGGSSPRNKPAEDVIKAWFDAA